MTRARRARKYVQSLIPRLNDDFAGAIAVEVADLRLDRQRGTRLETPAFLPVSTGQAMKDSIRGGADQIVTGRVVEWPADQKPEA